MPPASPGPDPDTASTTSRTSTTPDGAANEPNWLDEDERRAWLGLLEVTSGLFELLDRDLKAMAEITMEDYEILHLLSEADEQRLRVGTLSERMLASRTRLSQRIDRLGQRGLVRRERCPEDGRAINVVLTDEGDALLAEIAPKHLLSVRGRLFDHLTRTDVTSLGRSLDKVVRSLREQRAGLTG